MGSASARLPERRIMDIAVPRLQMRTNALVIALLILGANATCLATETFPVATPESQGLSSQSLDKLLGEVRGFVEKGEIVGGELLVIKNRRTVLHEAVGMADRETSKPLKVD